MLHFHRNVKMATTYTGAQSPITFSKTLERVFEDAQHTGEVTLSGRKLKEYPKICSKFDLVDTIVADLSKNRYTEIPPEICEYTSMERLSCYHNVIRSIPQALVQLQALTHLNLSRNMLCNIPPFICQLQALEVLIASNNKLISLPEELGQLERLMDLDVSCNEISHLPTQIGDLESLRILNVRRNLLVELPNDICKLKLRRLDFSGNKISAIPAVFRNMETLEELVLNHNPLTSPPAHVCTKGKVHIMKYLQIEAIREDRKRGMLSETDIKRLVRKSLPQHPVGSDDFKNINESPSWKRHTVVGNDSGYNTTDSNEKCNWSQMEVINDFDEINALALKAGEAVKEQRHHRELEAQRRIAQELRKHHTPPALPSENHLSAEPPPLPPHQNYSLSAAHHPPPSPQQSRLSVAQSPLMSRPHPHLQSPLPNSHSPLPHTHSPLPHTPSPLPHALPPGPSQLSPQSPVSPSPSSGNPAEDAFTRELQRQKADYERRKKVAEQIRVQQQQQEEIEREERRRTALKIQEEQHRVLEQKKEQQRRDAEANMAKKREAEAQQREESLRQEEAQARQRAAEEEVKRREVAESQVKQQSQIAMRTTTPGQAQPNSRTQTPTQTPTQARKKPENKRLLRPTRRNTGDNAASFIPIPVVHMNSNDDYEEVSSPESPSMLPRYDFTKNGPVGTTSAREDRRAYSSTTSHYRRTVSDTQTGRNTRTPQSNHIDNHVNGRNGITEEKVKSAGPSPASSVSSIASTRSHVSSTSSPRNVHTVRRIPVEDRRTATQSPVTRRTKAGTGTTSTTSTASTATAGRTRGSTSTIASRTRTTGTTGRAGTANSRTTNHMTPEEEFRMRHEAVVGQRQHTVRQRLEDEKLKIKQAQKEFARETVLSFISKRSAVDGDSNKNNNYTAPSHKNRQVLSSSSLKMLEDYKDSNPSFTIRRRNEQTNGDIEQLETLRHNIESRLKVTLPDNLPDALRDGVVLCHLANQVRPRSVASIHVPSPAVPKLTIAKCRRNVENFLEACRKIGVGNEQVCTPHDILDEKGILRLVITVGALIAIASNPKQSAV